MIDAYPAATLPWMEYTAVQIVCVTKNVSMPIVDALHNGLRPTLSTSKAAHEAQIKFHI